MVPRIAISRRARLFDISRFTLLSLMALVLTQCVPTRRSTVSYQAPLREAKDPDPTLPPVVVSVIDKRPTAVVGHPIGFFGEKEGDIISAAGASEALKKAFDIELRSEGFRMATGGNHVQVSMSFFQSQYEHPLFHTQAVASLGMDVVVKRPDGEVAYSTFILGHSEITAETHFESGESYASDALNAAMNDAITKTLADPAFMDALKTR